MLCLTGLCACSHRERRGAQSAPAATVMSPPRPLISASCLWCGACYLKVCIPGIACPVTLHLAG